MTDRENLKAIFTKANIAFDERIEKNTSNPASIYIEDGYPGFYTQFNFNEDDSLRSVEAYE